MSESTTKPAKAAAKHVHHELRNINNSAAYLLPKLQAMKDAAPGGHLKILDVGAGSGTISTGFAKLVPNGHVTATDLKEDILERARTIAEAEGVTNISFQQADAYKLPFPDATFDVVHCHQVLTHLSAPSDALREMLRVAKTSGGVVAAREGDLETECVWPPLPGLIKFHDFIVRAMKGAGGTSIAGRQLLSWALKAGVDRGQIEVGFGSWGFHEADEKRIWAQGMINEVRHGRLRQAGLRFGLTESDLEEMSTTWDEWAQKDDASLGMLQGELLIQK
ncbi:methylase [Podospora didyma]|uniref:Methylase n=1 Tax=Podospora didyma TaxID=330526 RepID=A0AAE0NGM9_9PEZI|nr:methylase [Podospora didyma]